MPHRATGESAPACDTYFDEYQRCLQERLAQHDLLHLAQINPVIHDIQKGLDPTQAVREQGAAAD